MDLGKYGEKFDELGIPRDVAGRYVESFNGKIFVVKGGGEVVKSKYTTAYDLKAMHDLGIKGPIFVHGGKKRIYQKLRELGMKSEFAGGYRITRPEMMKPIEEVLGEINHEFCNEIWKDPEVIAFALKALTYAVKHGPVKKGDRKIDLGLVGEPTSLCMEKEDLISMAERGIVVASSISIAKDGDMGAIYNTNADDVAGFVASDIEVEKLICLSDTDGVIIDGLRVPELGMAEAEKYIESGQIDGGMAPKVRCAIKAKRSGVRAVHIINGKAKGKRKHALLREIYSEKGIGTMIV